MADVVSVVKLCFSEAMALMPVHSPVRADVVAVQDESDEHDA